MKKLNKFYTVLIFLFLYLPMFVLIVASFNTGKDITDFEGFTLARYAELFRDNKLLPLLGNSLKMALLSSLLATIMAQPLPWASTGWGPGSAPSSCLSPTFP